MFKKVKTEIEKENIILGKIYLEYGDDVYNWKDITISQGNRKMHDIKSFSTIPVICCENCQHCSKKCYALKMCKLYKNVKKSYYRNTWLLILENEKVYNTLNNCLKNENVFRFNVAGDIFSLNYLKLIDKLAKNNNHCKILVFTKNYDLVNWFYTFNHKPDNLKLIFSDWTTEQGEKQIINNFLNFPVSDIIPKNTIHTFNENEKLCTGNCFNCFCNCSGCFDLKNGEKIYFNEH